ncbi:MAG: hypothetical protein ACP5MZ_04385 [Candidatus Micrarchaeia archaeon]
MSYTIALENGFDTKEMHAKGINPGLIYAANKLALAREFESKGESEAAERAAMKGVKRLIRVADNPNIQSWERGYVADLFGSIPDRLTSMTLEEMGKYISEKRIPVVTEVLSREYDMLTEGEVYSKHPWKNMLRRDIYYDFPNRRDE